jgi:hypothetical protein
MKIAHELIGGSDVTLFDKPFTGGSYWLFDFY